MEFLSAHPCRIAVFASGNGSNAENLITTFRSHSSMGCEVALIVANRADAPVVDRAAELGVEVAIINGAMLATPSRMLELLSAHRIDAIVLAGFLQFIPEWLIDRFPQRIINIHPSLLPKYGGRGMYGSHIHRAVIEAGETESGITIHLVSPVVDDGRIIYQEAIAVLPDDTPQSLEQKIHQLEYDAYPRVVADYLNSLNHPQP